MLTQAGLMVLAQDPNPSGDPRSVILDTAKSWQADLIVLGLCTIRKESKKSRNCPPILSVYLSTAIQDPSPASNCASSDLHRFAGMLASDHFD